MDVLAEITRETPRTANERAAGDLELTILMPCLNEAETIEVCVRKARAYLTASGVAGEVLVADNGSTDGSQALAQAAGARVVPIPERGYGAALIGGIAAARGRFVIMGDADDSYDLERLGPFVERLRAGADLVMGNRFKGGIAPGAMPFLHRYLGNPVLSFLGRLFFKVPIGDFHCGLRGFSRASIAALELVCPGMEFASEMVVKSALAGLRIEEAPTTLKPDGRSRAPHLKTWRDGWRHLRFLLLHSPRWLFLYPGLALIALGFGLAALLARGPVSVAPNLTLDIHSLLVGCFAGLVGLQLVIFSALARRYAYAVGILPAPASFGAIMESMTLERMLLAAAAIGVCGAGGVAWAVDFWADLRFGAIEYPMIIRVLMISLTAVAAAVQMAAAAFLMSLVSIRR